MTEHEKSKRYEDGTATSREYAIEQLVMLYQMELEEMHTGDLLFLFRKEWEPDCEYLVDEEEEAEDGTPFTVYSLVEEVALACN